MLRGVYSSHDGGRIAYHDGNSAMLQEEPMGSRFRVTVSSREPISLRNAAVPAPGRPKVSKATGWKRYPRSMRSWYFRIFSASASSIYSVASGCGSLDNVAGRQRVDDGCIPSGHGSKHR